MRSQQMKLYQGLNNIRIADYGAWLRLVANNDLIGTGTAGNHF